MEKNSGSWFHQHHRHPPLPNLNLLGLPFDTGHLNTEPVFRNPHINEDSIFKTVPSFPVSGLQQSKASEPIDSQNWFYRTPHRTFAPVLNSASKEKSNAGPFIFGQQRSPITGNPPSQKRFLVFDQSGDKTTLIYSSGVQTPLQYGNCWAPKPCGNNLSKEEPRDVIYPLRPISNAETIEYNSRDVTEDDMHEDTEELNALLCSDTENDFSEDDEETSTGHSPSTMTDNGIHDLVEEKGEEVDSFAGPTKRRKLPNGSSLKSYASSGLEDDDAESSCGNGNKQEMEELGSGPGGKRSRREKIRETVNILQSIIPSVNGKNTIVVIDEAIHYLRSLKVKAKALGLDTL
ncbi:hypothetical protein BUALT_Bualt11G0118900 [Buddleja alternifolia]|uniref:BHLH domain-containing protein n=1 Tax=Buddleja alternifolia TaxID=168488 RepID=A0AAV6WZ55_9LAMI|nr:hypothetical protein BUALT_Bualt11G0118900 [Buddleja alternifolia]